MRLTRAAQDLRTVKELLTTAEAAARRAGDALPGAEHLLVSALELPDGSARRSFARVGADPDKLVGAISATHAEALRGVGIVTGHGVEAPASSTEAPVTGALRTNASAQQAFQIAVKMSKETKPARLLGAHVVAAVCQLEHGTAARALAVLGIDRAALGAAAAQELNAAR